MKFRPLLSIDWSGSIGNNVASSARGGIQYLRAKVFGSNPQTFLQTVVRNTIAGLTGLWTSTLTQSNRDAWEALAQDEESGQNLFMSVNQARTYANSTGRIQLFGGGGTFQTYLAPPVGFTRSTPLTPPTTITVDASANSLVVTGFNEDDPFLANAVDTNMSALMVYISDPQDASRFARQHPYQLAQIGEIESPEIVNSFGGIQLVLADIGMTAIAGKVCYVKIQVQAPNGGLSTPVEERVLIQA